MDMFFLHNIKAELRLIEVKYEQLAGVSDVHINLDMDSVCFTSIFVRCA